MTVGLSEPKNKSDDLADGNTPINNNGEMSWSEYVKMCYISPEMGVWINSNLDKIRSGTVVGMPSFI